MKKVVIIANCNAYLNKWTGLESKTIDNTETVLFNVLSRNITWEKIFELWDMEERDSSFPLLLNYLDNDLEQDLTSYSKEEILSNIEHHPVPIEIKQEYLKKIIILEDKNVLTYWMKEIGDYGEVYIFPSFYNLDIGYTYDLFKELMVGIVEEVHITGDSDNWLFVHDKDLGLQGEQEGTWNKMEHPLFAKIIYFFHVEFEEDGEPNYYSRLCSKKFIENLIF